MTRDSHEHDVGMAQSRYQRVKDIYYQSTEKPPAEREAFIDQVSNGDQILRSEVMRLLAAPAEFEEFLERPAVNSNALREVAMASIAEAASAEPLPEHVGRYRIIRLVGEGGMGCVYEAQQDTPQRRVAVKVLRAGLMSHRLQQRFEQEVLILGRLQHPGIARIFDAGVVEVTAAGGHLSKQPFFAMEFIDGDSLIRYADTAALDTRARLELLLSVCDAVHHGHQRGVLHRDLKPANILVDTSSGSPQTKVIDFGVARITDADLALATMQTATGHILGTLAYMSPEQVSGESSGETIDICSDVYSLGVIGYELLSGGMPYDVLDKPIPAAARIIREDEPTRLSSISRVFRGDIETIFAKALEKDPARRYQSASELAGDIRRFLRNEPIVARPPSMRYQLGKFARRHTELVAGLALVLVVLVGGIVGISIALARALAGEHEAAQQADNAGLMNQFLIDMLANADPETSDRPDLKVRDVLGAAAARLEAGELSDRPAIAASLHAALGRSYKALTDYKPAIVHLTEALRIRRELLPPDHADTLALIEELAFIEFELLHYPRAIELANELLAAIERTDGRSSERAASTLTLLGRTYGFAMQFDRAMQCLDEAVAIRERNLSSSDVRLGNTYYAKAQVMNAQNRPRDAETYFRKTLEVLAQQSEPQPLKVAAIQVDRTNLLWTLGRFDDAEHAGREAREAYTKVYGPDHAYVMLAEGWLAQELQSMARFDEAEELMNHVLDEAKRAHGEESLTYMGSFMRLGGLSAARGDFEKARAQFQDAIERAKRLGGPRHQAVAAAEMGLAHVMLRTGNFDEALALAQHVLEIRREQLPATSSAMAPPLTLIGSVLITKGEFAQAESMIREALAIREAQTSDHWQVHALRSLHGAALAGLQRFEEAQTLLVNSSTALDAMRYVPEWERSEARRRLQTLDAMVPPLADPASPE